MPCRGHVGTTHTSRSQPITRLSTSGRMAPSQAFESAPRARRGHECDRPPSSGGVPRRPDWSVHPQGRPQRTRPGRAGPFSLATGPPPSEAVPSKSFGGWLRVDPEGFGTIQNRLATTFGHMKGQRSQLCSVIGQTDVMVHRGRRRHRAACMDCAKELATADAEVWETRLAEHY